MIYDECECENAGRRRRESEREREQSILLLECLFSMLNGFTRMEMLHGAAHAVEGKQQHVDRRMNE